NKPAVEEELGKGNLFATGLVAGGALAGVLIALLRSSDSVYSSLENISRSTVSMISGILGNGGYQLLGVFFFILMGWILYKVATRKDDVEAVINDKKNE